MALELWQEAFIDKPQDMQVLQKSLQLLRPIVDARVNPVSHPEYYERILPELQSINVMLADATGGRDFIETFPDPTEMQFMLIYGTMHKLWMLLRVYVQGASVAACDAGRAAWIQELFMSVTQDPVEEP